MTGKTSEGETVNVKVLNFTPFFWIELPSEFKKHQKDTLLVQNNYHNSCG